MSESNRFDGPEIFQKLFRCLIGKRTGFKKGGKLQVVLTDLLEAVRLRRVPQRSIPGGQLKKEKIGRRRVGLDAGSVTGRNQETQTNLFSWGDLRSSIMEKTSWGKGGKKLGPC